MGQTEMPVPSLTVASFSIRSFGSFDGTLCGLTVWVERRCFSIRSFGSFDGTLCKWCRRVLPKCFSIRSFGSFDGTVLLRSGRRHAMGFQYPLFRII